MRSAVGITVLALVLGPPWVQAEEQTADAVLGTWLTSGDDRAQVLLYRASEEGPVQGRIIALEQPRFPADDPTHPGELKVDRENPDPALRDRPVEGLVIARGFTFDGDDTWEDGRIYDPESGKTYKGKMWLTDDGRLKLRGYIGFSLLGRTEVWTSVEDEPRAPDTEGEGG